LVKPLHANLFEITFRAPELALRAAPGEFAELLVAEGPLPLLRRPLSFSRADPNAGTVSFYLGAVGEGSRRLARFHPGDELRILGPLGQGFSLPEMPGRSLLLSGGLGAAPFPLLAERLLAQGEEVAWLDGARTEPELYPTEFFPPGVERLPAFTEDGSSGRRGRVIDELGESGKGVQRVYACGPNAMLSAVARLWSELHPNGGPRLEVSIEAPMGCGFGTCLGCAIPIRDPGAELGPLGLCCRQGPVLESGQLDWERLLRQPSHLA
jgi:dihydroorotate dehydrogenase electron transfer subunit